MPYILFWIKNWQTGLLAPSLIVVAYVGLGFPDPQNMLVSLGLPDWSRYVIVGILILLVTFRMSVLFSREEAQRLPVYRVISTNEVYSQMAIDAETAEALYLTSFLSGHQEGQQKEPREEYFKIIQDIIRDKSKPITRMEVFQGDSQKITKVEDLVELGRNNPKFKLMAMELGDDYPPNLQIFFPISAYIFDPIFAQDSAKTRARHIRFTGTHEIEKLLLRYKDALKSSVPIKDEKVDERQLSVLRKDTEDNQIRALRESRAPLVYDIELNSGSNKYDFSHRALRELEVLNWSELSDRISREEALVSYTVQDLITRCEERRSAVAVQEHEIVCHVSATTLLDKQIGQRLTGSRFIGLGDALR
ncbi:MAG: hypothetical protein AAFQ87_23850, partial [Bacteroidota bacterium]